jgi:hypothetical protein
LHDSWATRELQEMLFFRDAPHSENARNFLTTTNLGLIDLGLPPAPTVVASELLNHLAEMEPMEDSDQN